VSNFRLEYLSETKIELAEDLERVRDRYKEASQHQHFMVKALAVKTCLGKIANRSAMLSLDLGQTLILKLSQFTVKMFASHIKGFASLSG